MDYSEMINEIMAQRRDGRITDGQAESALSAIAAAISDDHDKAMRRLAGAWNPTPDDYGN